MRKKLFIVLLSLLLLPAFPGRGNADSTSIPIQGFVIDSESGNPLEEILSVTFNLYETCDDEEAAYSETQSVEFTNGLYGTSLEVPQEVIESSETLCLGVQLEGDSEMSPRMEYFSVPYARIAQQAETAALADVALALDSGVLTELVGNGLNVSGDTISLDTSSSQTWTATQTYSSQVVVSSDPADTSSSNASFKINPSSSSSDEKFFVVQNNGTDRFTVDAEGDVTISGNLTVTGSLGGSGLGDITGVTAGTGLTGGGSSGDVTLTSVLGTSIESSEITDDTISASDLAADSVNSSEIATDAVGSGEISADAVTSSEIGTDAVGSSEIAADAVGTSEIATDGVASAEITADSVGSSELTSTSVTAGSYTVASITVDADGRVTSASSGTETGDISSVTAGTGLTGGGTSGDITLSSVLGISIDSSEITDDTISASDLAADSVSSSEIATDAVGSDEISVDAVGSSEISADAVGSSEIASDAVGSSELASTSVTAGSYTLASITVDADGRVTSASSDAASEIAFLFNGTDTSSRTASYVIGTAGGEDQVVALGMTCDNLHFQVDTAPGSGDTWTATVQVNGSNTSLTCAITGTSTTCSDTSNSTGSISAGNMVQLNVVETGTAAGTAGSSWSMVCYPD